MGEVHLLGNMDGSDHRSAQHLLLLAQYIFEEIYGDVVVRRQVDSVVAGQEVIDLALAAILGVELLERDSNQLLWLSWRDLLHFLISVLHELQCAILI